MALVRSLAYVLLSLALVAAALMIVCFVLAVFGVGSRPWAALALPLGMGSLFLFGAGVVFARTANSHAELHRAIRLLHRDVREALSSSEPDLSRRLDLVLPGIARFQRAARESTARPKALQDLVDLFDYEQQHDRARAESLLHELDRALTAVERQQRPPPRSPRKPPARPTSRSRSR